MNTTISPELQEKIDYVLGKSEGYIMYPAIKVRLEKQPVEIQKEILDSKEFNKYCLDYVLGKTQREPVSFSGSLVRLNQLEHPARKVVINDKSFKELAINYVLAKGQDNKISQSEAKKRMELIPEELRKEIEANPQVFAAFPGIA